MYTYGDFVPSLIPEWGNWTMMFIGLFVVVGLVTRASKELMILGLMYNFLLEDVVYWMCQWIDTGIYPYPAPNWFDSFFASFRVLGGLGTAIPFFPYIPFFYIPGFITAILFYVFHFINPKAGRFVSWIAGPLFIGVILGTIPKSEIVALYLFAGTLVAAMIYITIVYLLQKYRSMELVGKKW